MSCGLVWVVWVVWVVWGNPKKGPTGGRVLLLVDSGARPNAGTEPEKSHGGGCANRATPKWVALRWKQTKTCTFGLPQNVRNILGKWLVL